MGLTVDIGTGDGAFVLRRARAEGGVLHLGIDSNPEAMGEISRKAARKAERGGAPNALFVHAGVEDLPDTLDGLATEVTVLLPWGSLLRGVARPEAAVLATLRRLCRPQAGLRVVLGYDARSDPAADLAPLTAERLVEAVLPHYREAGFEVRAEALTVAEVRHLGTTWGSRLAFGKARPFFQIVGQRRG